MAINKRKVLEIARKYAQKGAHAKALKEFDKLLKLDPRDARLRLEIGDAHRRWGNVAEAIETYTRVAEQYTKEGFDARAVAVYKQIHNLTPDAYESYAPLAELYQRMGLDSEAILALQTAADGYHKQGKKIEALDLLRKMAMLDPTNTTSRIKVADLLRQEGMIVEAIAEYDQAGAELERQGDFDAATGVYERILEVEPNRRVTLVRLAEKLVERGLADRAEPFVKRVLAAEPDEPSRYELMATVYRLQQRDEELADVYRTLAELYRRRGDDDHAREILQRYVPTEEFEKDEIGIDDQTAFGALDSAIELGASGTQMQFTQEDYDSPFTALAGSHSLDAPDFDPDASAHLGDEPLESDADFLPLDDDEADPVEIELDDPLDPPSRGATVGEPDRTADSEQLLAEASVYLRYGKREQAIANLQAIVARDGGHRIALEKLGGAHAEAGDETQAIAIWLQAADAARAEGDFEAVSVLRDRIAAIDPEAAKNLGPPPSGDSALRAGFSRAEGEATVVALDAFSSVDSDSDSRSDADSGREIDLDDIEIDIDASEFADEISAAADDDEESPPEVPAASATTSGPAGGAGLDAAAEDSSAYGPGASAAMVQQIGEDLEEADFYMKQGLAGDAEVIYRRVLSIAPNHPHALVRLGEVAALRGEDPATTHPGHSNPETSNAGSEAPGSPADESDMSFRDDIPGPDDDEMASAGDSLRFVGSDDPREDSMPEFADEPFVESAVAPELASAEGPRPDDSESESDLEEQLSARFLAEVTEPTGSALPSDSSTEAADSSADLSAPNLESAFEISMDDDSTASESSSAESDANAISSPDDSFTDSELDLGDVPELTAPETKATSTEPEREEASFDLAAELSDVFDDEDGISAGGPGDSGDGFEAVFREFKKGVSLTLSEDDHEAHFDLGIAYREMGLYDDAKSEFRAAMLNSEREIQCRHMLGLCCLAQESYDEAVSEFEQIAAAADATDQQQLSAQYELGRAFEALNQKERARIAYEVVAEVDPDFCGVGDRLKALDAPPAPAGQGADLESFDDLIADAESAEPEPATEAASEYESFDDLMAEGEAESRREEAETVNAGPEPDEKPEAAFDSDPEVVVPESVRPKKRNRISFV